jgi:hypothetical protein
MDMDIVSGSWCDRIDRYDDNPTHTDFAAGEPAGGRRVHIDGEVRFGDVFADVDGVALLRVAQVLESVGILGVVAEEPSVGGELARQVGADQLRQLVRRELPMQRVRTEQRDTIARDAGTLECLQNDRDRRRPDRCVAGDGRVVVRDRHPASAPRDLGERG